MGPDNNLPTSALESHRFFLTDGLSETREKLQIEAVRPLETNALTA
jgi:hypothetical protein